MRTRDKQRIYKRFFDGWTISQLAWTMPTKRGGYPQSQREQDVENIIREGHAKGWDSGKREVK